MRECCGRCCCELNKVSWRIDGGPRVCFDCMNQSNDHNNFCTSCLAEKVNNDCSWCDECRKNIICLNCNSPVYGTEFSYNPDKYYEYLCGPNCSDLLLCRGCCSFFPEDQIGNHGETCLEKYIQNTPNDDIDGDIERSLRSFRSFTDIFEKNEKIKDIMLNGEVIIHFVN